MNFRTLPDIAEVPAAHLVGLDLPGGWRVTELVTNPGSTGGAFSISYLVRHDDQGEAFLKALNLKAAAVGPGSFVDRINNATGAFRFERDLLKDCRDQRLSRIIRILDDGETVVPGAGDLMGTVPYLIFEKAEGDIRTFLGKQKEFDVAWAFRTLKHSAEGLRQLHSNFKAHQDLKPSNVLTQAQGREMKLGDLGRAGTKAGTGPWADWNQPGDGTYAPPEQLYGSFGRTWEARRAADLYLLGSLATQLFSHHSMTVQIVSRLDHQFRPQKWAGSFKVVVPYLQNAHADVLDEFRVIMESMLGDDGDAARLVAGVGHMTQPDPDARGHPKDLKAQTSSYLMQRHESLFNMMMAKAEARLLRLSFDQ